MADGTTTTRTWLYPTQGSIPRCPSIEIWPESNKYSRLRQSFLYRTQRRFSTIRHNEIRDLTADLLTEVCNDVRIEPDLQPITEETLRYVTANTARLDISANGGRLEKTYFDFRVFNPHALTACFKRGEKRSYEQRVREIEHASFTPFTPSTTGGMGREATTFYKLQPVLQNPQLAKMSPLLFPRQYEEPDPLAARQLSQSQCCNNERPTSVPCFAFVSVLLLFLSPEMESIRHKKKHSCVHGNSC